MAQAFDITRHRDQTVDPNSLLDLFFSEAFEKELSERGLIDGDMELTIAYDEGRDGTVPLMGGKISDKVVEAFTGKDGKLTVGSIADRLTRGGAIDMAGLSELVSGNDDFATNLGLTEKVAKAQTADSPAPQVTIADNGSDDKEKRGQTQRQMTEADIDQAQGAPSNSPVVRPKQTQTAEEPKQEEKPAIADQKLFASYEQIHDFIVVYAGSQVTGLVDQDTGKTYRNDELIAQLVNSPDAAKALKITDKTTHAELGQKLGQGISYKFADFEEWAKDNGFKLPASVNDVREAVAIYVDQHANDPQIKPLAGALKGMLGDPKAELTQNEEIFGAHALRTALDSDTKAFAQAARDKEEIKKYTAQSSGFSLEKLFPALIAAFIEGDWGGLMAVFTGGEEPKTQVAQEEQQPKQPTAADIAKNAAANGLDASEKQALTDLSTRSREQALGVAQGLTSAGVAEKDIAAITGIAYSGKEPEASASQGKS